MEGEGHVTLRLQQSVLKIVYSLYILTHVDGINRVWFVVVCVTPIVTEGTDPLHDDVHMTALVGLPRLYVCVFVS